MRSPWNRKKLEAARVEDDIMAARESRERGTAANKTLDEAVPGLLALAATVRKRRQENHFGQDFTISMTPRKRNI